MSDQVLHLPLSPNWCLITLVAFNKKPVGQFSKNPPLLLMCPLSHFPSIDSSLTLLLGSKFPLAYDVFKVEPNLSPQLQNPLAVVPTPIEVAPIWITSFLPSLASFMSNFFLNSINRKRPDDGLCWACTSTIQLTEFTTDYKLAFNLQEQEEICGFVSTLKQV